MSSASWLDAHFEAMRPEYEDALRWVGIQRDWHVLDAGCGSGGYLPLLAELVGQNGRVNALDLAPENVQVVQTRIDQNEFNAPITVRQGNLLKLPYDDATFDVVWCANTVQYLTDGELDAALQEFKRVTKPGGLVAIKDFDASGWAWQPLPTFLFAKALIAYFSMHAPDAIMALRTAKLASWMQRADLHHVCQQHFSMVRTAPLRPVERQYIVSFLKYWGNYLQDTDLPTDNKQFWAKLADTDAPNHLIDQPDFAYREIQIVFVGRV